MFSRTFSSKYVAHPFSLLRVVYWVLALREPLPCQSFERKSFHRLTHWPEKRHKLTDELLHSKVTSDNFSPHLSDKYSSNMIQPSHGSNWTHGEQHWSSSEFIPDIGHQNLSQQHQRLHKSHHARGPAITEAFSSTCLWRGHNATHEKGTRMDNRLLILESHRGSPDCIDLPKLWLCCCQFQLAWRWNFLNSHDAIIWSGNDISRRMGVSGRKASFQNLNREKGELQCYVRLTTDNYVRSLTACTWGTSQDTPATVWSPSLALSTCGIRRYILLAFPVERSPFVKWF